MLATATTIFFETQIVEVRYQRSLLGWIIIGLIAGWLACKISRG